MVQTAPNQDLYYFGINPEPWAIGDLSVGRRNGKYFPMVGRNNQMFSYQEALREAIELENDQHNVCWPGLFELECWFWRRRDDYQTPQARRARSHEADGTNLFKATEDALQKVLYTNDRNCIKGTWHLVSQKTETVSGVAILITRIIEEPDELDAPTSVLLLRGKSIGDHAMQIGKNNNLWKGPE